MYLQFDFLANDHDIPQIAVAVGVPNDNLSSSSPESLAVPSPSATDSHASPSPITPILRSARESLYSLGSPTHSDNSSLPPPPSPTLSAHSGSVRWANSALLRDNNPEEHDGPGSSSSYLASPPHGHRRKGSIGIVSSIGSGPITEQDANDSSSFRLSPLRSGHSDVTSLLPSESSTHTHVGDTASDAGLTPSSGAELAPPAMLDPKQEAGLNVERMGGVDVLRRGLGSHPTHGLSTESRSPPAHLASPDPILQSVAVSHPTDNDPPKPDIMITPSAGEPEGLQSTVSLGGEIPAGVIEDRRRLFRSEIWWRDRYRDLEAHGYRLRNRYHPDWEPSWKKSGEDFFNAEDGQPTIVSIISLVQGLVRSAPTIFVQLRAAMDAVRIADGKQVILKKVLPEEGPYELSITQLFTSPELKGDPKNHCIPLLDVVDLSQTSPDGRKLMVMPFLRPFKNPRFQTYGEFVAFFIQITEVGPSTLSSESADYS